MKIFKRKKKSNLNNCNISSLSYRYISIEFVPAPDLKLYILILFWYYTEWTRPGMHFLMQHKSFFLLSLKIKVLSHLHFSLALLQQKANLLPGRSYLACSHLHNRYVKCKYTLNIWLMVSNCRRLRMMWRQGMVRDFLYFPPKTLRLKTPRMSTRSHSSLCQIFLPKL